jgi:S-disulfanyl-L-cysteine oxidoreductase SoxD
MATGIGVTVTRFAFGAAVMFLVGAVSGACDWPWRHDMADQPSPATRQGPRPPAEGTWPLAETGPVDPAAGESISNPLSADQTAIGAGRVLYEKYCRPCHGTSGSGSDSVVARYFPRVGDLSSPAVQQHGDGWLYAVITIGTQTMPAYGHELDSRERWQIVCLLRTLRH